MAVRAGKETHTMPRANTTGRAELDLQVVEGHPQLVTFALEKHWEPVEGSRKRGWRGACGLLSIKTRPQRQPEEEVELVHCPHCIWTEKFPGAATCGLALLPPPPSFPRDPRENKPSTCRMVCKHSLFLWSRMKSKTCVCLVL